MSKENPFGYATANVAVVPRTPLATGEVGRVNVTVLLDLKPFSYCMNAGCSRKESRRGRPDPERLKDHSDPVEDTHTQTAEGHKYMLLFK